MAVKTVYKATDEYKSPTGSIYLDSASKGRTGSSTGSSTAGAYSTGGSSNSGAASAIIGNAGTGTGTGTTVSASSRSTSSGRSPYTMSDETRNLKNISRSYADEADDLEYTPSETLTNYKNKLNDIENSKPAAFQSKYTDQINSLLDSIINEKEFSYTGKDLMNDDMYKMYSEMYEKNARKAMQNAQGEAAALTGGYGSTYSQAAGQQAYDDTMSNMNDIALQLADSAYEKYLNERSNRYNQLSTVNNQDNIDYTRYRDDVGDWQTDRVYYAGRYDDTYDREYNAYRDAVADKQWMSNYYSNLYGTDAGNELSAWQANEAMQEWEDNYALSKNADAREEAAAAREAEEWEYNKQLLALQIAQAQAAASGSGSGSGRSSGRKSGSSSDSGTGYSGLINNNISWDIARDSDVDTETAVEAIDEAYWNYYSGKLKSTGERGKAQALNDAKNNYMHATGASAYEANQHFKNLVSKRNKKQ